MTRPERTLAETASPASGRVKVLYLIGWGRSGSTLLDMLLGEVTGFFSTGELRSIWKEGLQEGRSCGCGRSIADCPVWKPVLEDLTHTHDLDPNAMAKVQRDALRTRHTWGLIRALWAHRDPAQAVARYAAVQGALYAAIRTVTGARVVVDSSKMPSNATLLGFMPEVEPYLLHLVRDPRASAYSWQRQKARLDGADAETLPRFGLAQSSVNWLAFNLAAEAIGRQHPTFRCHELRYEDFVAAPRDALERIVDFVGESASLPFTGRDTVDLGINHTVSGNPGRFRTGRVEIREDEEWKARQPRTHRLAVTLATAPMLRRYRYPFVVGRPTPRTADV